MKHDVPNLLDEIKAKYENLDHRPIVTYKLVLQSYFGDSPVCDIDQEYVTGYDELCGRLFNLDVFGWEIVRVEDNMPDFISPYKFDIVEYVLVTITLCRKQ